MGSGSVTFTVSSTHAIEKPKLENTSCQGSLKTTSGCGARSNSQSHPPSKAVEQSQFPIMNKGEPVSNSLDVHNEI